VEQEAVREMFRRFLWEHSVQRVVEWASENKVLTKNGRQHTRVSVKGILSNPVYAVADADSYLYFPPSACRFTPERGL
jgi:site-specific DNA recombinase